jgi:hypothetical protein
LQKEGGLILGVLAQGAKFFDLVRGVVLITANFLWSRAEKKRNLIRRVKKWKRRGEEREGRKEEGEEGE